MKYQLLASNIFTGNIAQIRIIFTSIRMSGMKIDTHKFSLGLKYIPCFGYLITWGSIKPYLKKVQGIVYIDKPTRIIEAQVLICMVH